MLASPPRLVTVITHASHAPVHPHEVLGKEEALQAAANEAHNNLHHKVACEPKEGREWTFSWAQVCAPFNHKVLVKLEIRHSLKEFR